VALNLQTTQVAAEPAVPPAEDAEPGEENELIASLFPFVLRPIFRVPCQRFRPLVGFVPVRFIAWVWLVFSDGVRLHLGCSPSGVGFAFALLLYCLPCFFAQFYVVVLILVSGTFFSLVIAAHCLGWFSCYAYIFLVSFPTQSFARAFGHEYAVHDFLPPSPISLACCHSCIVPNVSMPLCSTL